MGSTESNLSPAKPDMPLPMARISYAELLSLRADRARLDWLEKHSYRTAPTVPPRVYVIAHSSVWPAGAPKQLRAAIDAANCA